MWVNEYKQCLLMYGQLETLNTRLVWMPVNGARIDAAVDLNNDGKLWTVIKVYQEPVYDLEVVKIITANNPDYGCYVEGYHGNEQFAKAN
jgi:hypothetical protein